MNFLKLFLRGVALLPSVIQSVAALSIVQATIGVADAVQQKTVVDASGFTKGLGAIVDGVVACLNASLWNKA